MRKSENLTGYAFIAPWVIGFIGLTVIPFVSLVGFSFSSFDLLSPARWLGWDNYVRIWEDVNFWTSLQVTFTYAFVSTPLRLAVALFVALLLVSKRKMIGFYRTAFYLPSIIGGSVAVAVMWRNLFSHDGLVNSLILQFFGFNPEISWVTDPRTALWSLVLLSIWQFGASMLIFLAGLKNIPASYYEAASVDGVNGFQKFIHITLPMLSPVIFFNLVMQLINGFLTFTQGLVITNGGPMSLTLFFQLYVYRKGFESFEMGYASALSCVLLLITAALTALVFRSSNKWVHYESK